MKCETCRYWGGRVSGLLYTPGPCLRYPPISDQHHRPMMSIRDWCGEHQPKDATHDQ